MKLSTSRTVEIYAKDSLGLAAYLNGHFNAPGSLIDDDNDDNEDNVSQASGSSAHQDVDGVLALHIAEGQKYVLIDWANHTIPSWHVDNGEIAHKLTGDNLEGDLSDESSDFQQTCSPAAYTAFSGDLAPLRCCSTCENEVLDCFDYRLYIDASGPSNVSAPLSLRLSLFSLAQYTRFMVRVQVSVYR